MNNGKIVISCYQPKPGQQQELLEVLKDHVPQLRMLGFATGYPRTLMLAGNGTVIEIFEWESEQASRAAHDNPEVKKMWDAIGRLADFVPLSSLPESQKAFSHFTQPPNDRQHRAIHFEIPADDPARCMKFYEQVFGWQYFQWGPNEYWLADTGSEPCPGIDGAILKRRSPGHTMANTIAVENIDEYIQKVERAGGKIVVPKTSLGGVGHLAYAHDPEGNLFGIMQTDRSAS